MSNRTEIALVLLLCFAAALRVFIFSAAFPFFSDVDEHLHFDLITKYSLTGPPYTFRLLNEESLAWIVPYNSPEFVQTPEEFPGGQYPTPLWKQSAAEAGPLLAETKAAWSTEINFESAQPPLYYMLGAVWWQIGKGLGLTGIESLYWIRFLNIPLIATLVWLGYVTARTIAPERSDLRIGVPLLLAFIPQSGFYAMNNDVLSPICCGALFLCLLRWLRADPPTLSLGACTGLAIAASYLSKLTTLPLLIVAVIFIFSKSLPQILRKPGGTSATLGLLILSAAIPIGGWMMWTKYHFGDLTGSATKIALLGWTRIPFMEWWQHPVFTPGGLWVFWSDLLATFWRGEVNWQDQPLHSQVIDRFYSISSLLFLCAAVAGIRKGTSLSVFQRQAIALAGLGIVASVLFLVLLSIQFDFGNCVNPSREHPYFTSGRLLSGIVIPFAFLYAQGLAYLLRRLGPVRPLMILIVIVALVTAWQSGVNRVVFASEYNWFHR